MSDDKKEEEEEDLTPEELAKSRPDPITDPERETYEGKIRELQEQRDEALAELAEFKKKKEEPKAKKPKSFSERFNPLG